MSTEIPILYNELRKEFDQALTNTQSGFVERPKGLEKLSRRRREFIEIARRNNRKAREELDQCSTELVNEYGIDKLKAKDIVIRSWDIEERLGNEGAVFGDIPFNFSLDRLVITREEEKQISLISQNVMAALRLLAKRDLLKDFNDTLPLSPVELVFEKLRLTPNAARLDFILTENGPKLIEINSQWVDAITALEGFQKVWGMTGQKPTEKFAQALPPFSNIAIIDVNQGIKGSRDGGASKELQTFAKRLSMYEDVKSCEVIDPQKTRLEYLQRFSTFYINCDPRFFGENFPDWTKAIATRARQNRDIIYPAWRPLLDKKIFLAILYNPTLVLAEDLKQSGVDVNLLSNSICETRSLEEYVQDEQLSQQRQTLKDLMGSNLSVLNLIKLGSSRPFVVKGDGYSLNSVALSTSPNFYNYLPSPGTTTYSYVIQPFLEGKRVDAWVFDTYKQRVKFLKNAYTKLNVWFLNGKVVGMLATLSESPLISDKGYNVVPLIK